MIVTPFMDTLLMEAGNLVVRLIYLMVSMNRPRPTGALR